MKNYIERGDEMNYTVPAGKTVKSGDVVVVEGFTGIAVTDGKEGDLVALAAVGVYQVPSGNAPIKQGQKVYYDTAAKQAVSLTGDVYLGVAWANSGGGFVDVKLDL